MKTKTFNTWVVARLNCNEPWLAFFTKCLKPLVDSTTRTGIVERYYWERSNDRGANIQVYFRCTNEEVAETILKPNIKHHFESYFAAKPSFQKAKMPSSDNNRIVQFIEYQPNVADWGGEVGLPIAERHFQSSSDAILDFMDMKKDKWTTDEIMATAIEMHLAFADATDMDTEEATRFFEYCLLHHSTEDFRMQYFEEFFDTQREPLIAFHSLLWESLETKQEFKEDIYNQWRDHCFYTSADIIRTFRQRVLKIEAKFSAIWAMYAKLLHKTNNRLGIMGRDESLIYYLMMRSLEKIETKAVGSLK